MARTHRRIKTGRLVARALDNTFTGTSHIVAIIYPQRKPWRWTRLPKGQRFTYAFATLHGPNGFPGDTGKLYR